MASPAGCATICASSPDPFFFEVRQQAAAPWKPSCRKQRGSGRFVRNSYLIRLWKGGSSSHSNRDWPLPESPINGTRLLITETDPRVARCAHQACSSSPSESRPSGLTSEMVLPDICPRPAAKLVLQSRPIWPSIAFDSTSTVLRRSLGSSANGASETTRSQPESVHHTSILNYWRSHRPFRYSNPAGWLYD